LSREVRLRVAAWGLAALAAGVLSLVLELRSDHEEFGAVILVVDLLLGWCFAAAGLIAMARRQENKTGALLLMVALTWFVSRFEAADDAALYTVGSVANALPVAALLHLVLAYPLGRLQTRVERAIVPAGYALALLANVFTLTFDPHPSCSKCPTNSILISDRPSVADAVDTTANILAVGLLGAAVVIVVRRYRAATPVARRTLRPIVMAGGAAIALLLLAFAVGPFYDTAQEALASIALLVLATVPFWFLIGLLRSRLAVGGVAQLLADVRETASVEEAQEGLRRALNDPGVCLATWVEERRGYVDPHGRAFAVPENDADRVSTLVAGERGDPVAVIVHDRSLLDEPDLVDGVASAARLALQRNRLQAELQARLDELQRERDFMRDVVNAAPAFFLVIDLDGRVIRFNDTMAEACGVADDDRVRGRHFWDVFPVPEDADESRVLTAARATGEHEHRWRAANGGELVIAWTMIPINDSQGVPRLVITGADVSERVHHADEIRRERDFHEIVGRSTQTLLCTVDVSGVVTERGVNAAFTAATGYDDEQAVGRPFWELAVRPEHVPSVRAAFAAAVGSGTSPRTETPWRAADGSELSVEWWVASLAAYREGQYLIAGNDITKRKRDEDEVRRSRSRLVEAADAERRRLERNLHDGAQQRLVSLSLALRLAESKVRHDPAATGEILAGAGEELSLALRELRELARGLHPAVLTDRGLAAALESLAERSPLPVELVVDLDRRLPGQVEVAVYYVVSEALANVSKYAAATGATVRVAHEADALAVEVSDDGVGGADPAGGSGLRGLADRVAALDGSLRVESPPGEGTRVLALIPLAEVREPVPQDAG
jgi:PAS domain S-box-containing protein